MRKTAALPPHGPLLQPHLVLSHSMLIPTILSYYQQFLSVTTKSPWLAPQPVGVWNIHISPLSSGIPHQGTWEHFGPSICKRGWKCCCPPWRGDTWCTFTHCANDITTGRFECWRFCRAQFQKSNSHLVLCNVGKAGWRQSVSKVSYAVSGSRGRVLGLYPTSSFLSLKLVQGTVSSHWKRQLGKTHGLKPQMVKFPHFFKWLRSLTCLT